MTSKKSAEQISTQSESISPPPPRVDIRQKLNQLFPPECNLETHRVELHAGEVLIFSKQDQPEEAYVLWEGTLEESLFLPSGDQMLICEWTPGHVVAAQGLLPHNRPAQTSTQVSAKTDATVLILTRDHLKSPLAYTHLFQSMSHAYVNAVRAFSECVSIKTLTHPLGQLLEKLARRWLRDPKKPSTVEDLIRTAKPHGHTITELRLQVARLEQDLETAKAESLQSRVSMYNYVHFVNTLFEQLSAHQRVDETALQEVLEAVRASAPNELEGLFKNLLKPPEAPPTEEEEDDKRETIPAPDPNT